jgi:hypothetical protein
MRCPGPGAVEVSFGLVVRVPFHMDLLRQRESPHCIPCTARHLRRDDDNALADARGLRIGTDILSALPLWPLTLAMNPRWTAQK